ncbi:hypothetical protein DM01DRAFT_1400564 [Hesseltinella vesiculosa]|uniref:Uncharacterized protein n=1 Tax=Hesseltinella vesiculosa TaxID=101127 RepID=A0A1X2G2G6_9FUNG|nr:hypothetical protein DM01DRAFT_1400564 [Hesseltinella vesiculosa]
MGRKRSTQMEDTRSTTKPALTITSTEEAIEALNTQIKHFLTDQLRKHKDRDKLKADLLGKQRLPKGLLLNIDQLCGKTAPWFAPKYHKRFHFLDTWRGYINHHYDELAAMIPAPTASSSKTTSPSQPTKPTQKEEIRVAHKSLRQILLPAINESPEALSNVLSTIKDARIAVTKYSRDMFTLLHTSVLKYATNPNADWYTSASVPGRVTVSNLLPSFAQRNLDQVKDGQFSTLPPPTSSSCNDVFGIQHIQYLYSSHFGHTRESTKTSHPNWSHLAVDWSFDPPSKWMTSNVRSVYHNKLDTSFKNILAGKSFVKMTRYLVRLLLRLWLAPIREQRHTNMKKSFAKKKRDNACALHDDPAKKMKALYCNTRNALRRKAKEMSKKRSRGALNERQQAGFDRRMSNLQEKMVSLDFFGMHSFISLL